MLFRCLHPMELDTGPWPRKSSILCSLLLFASFFVIQVTGQATEIVGLGKHTLLKDGKVNLNTEEYDNYIGVKNIDPTEYKTLFPDACDVTIKDEFIELQYKGELCTVDLLSDFNDKIKFKAEVRNSSGIDECLEKGSSPKTSYSNLLPFIYSKNNDVIKDFSTRGPFENNDTTCGEGYCYNRYYGNCLHWTSLEVSWSRVKDRSGHVAYGHASLIADVKEDKMSQQANEKKKKASFDLEIKADSTLRMNQKGYNPSDYAVCAPENDTIVEPKAWTINNTLLKDEYLLVFSMLPTSVSKVFNGTHFTEEKPNMPKCTLFIQFSTKDYRLLTVIPPPTTTTSTTTQTTTTTTTEAPSTTTISCPTVKSEPVTTTTTRPTEKTCQEESKTLLIVFLIIGWLLVAAFLLFVGALFIYRWMEEKERKERRRKEKEAFVPKPEQTDEEAEEEQARKEYDAIIRNKGMKTHGSYGTWKKTRNIRFKENFHLEMKHPKIYNKEYVPELIDKGFAAVGTFEEWFNKNKSATATSTMIEQPPTTTKTALGTDKSEVDKGKSTKTALDAKKPTTTVIEIPQNAEESKAEGAALEEAKPDENGEVKSKAENEA